MTYFCDRVQGGPGGTTAVEVSQNVPGGDEHNALLIERYGRRLPLMKP